jgi:hypothetical protein
LVSFSNENNTISTVYLYNFKRNEYLKYLVTFDKKNIIKVFDDTKNFLYSVNINTKYISVNNISLEGKQSCFGSCVGKKTEEFCDDFIGAVAYATNPQIAILIAGFCQGCCNGWWSQGCP